MFACWNTLIHYCGDFYWHRKMDDVRNRFEFFGLKINIRFSGGWKKNISFIGLQKYPSKNRIRLITMLTSGNIETNSNTLFYLEVDSHLQFFVFSFFEVFCKFKEINLFQWVIIKIESFELNIKSQSSNNEKTHIILIQLVKLKCSHNSFFPALRKTPNLMSTKTFSRAFKT